MQKTITLDTPITRGQQTITEVTLTKPNAGALRGVSLVSLMNMDVTALVQVLPRITEPTLTAADVNNMDPADLVQVAMEVAGFLAPKSVLEASRTT